VTPHQNQENIQMQKLVRNVHSVRARNVHAIRADEFGRWQATVLTSVGFSTLLLIVVIAVRWLS
jgi:hypothetical protein